MDQFTTATADIPADGTVLTCWASTACPHVVLGVDDAQAKRLLADHLNAHHNPKGN
jgi:hypothetical protein